jgi:hypothetical protein
MVPGLALNNRISRGQDSFLILVKANNSGNKKWLNLLQGLNDRADEVISDFSDINEAELRWSDLDCHSFSIDSLNKSDNCNIALL